MGEASPHKTPLNASSIIKNSVILDEFPSLLITASNFSKQVILTQHRVFTQVPFEVAFVHLEVIQTMQEPSLQLTMNGLHVR